MLEVGQYTNEELMRTYRAGDDYAADVLWEQNKGLTLTFIGRYMKSSEFNEEELHSMAHFAFTSAIKYYDESKGWKFTTLYDKSFRSRISNEIVFNHRPMRSEMKCVSLQSPIKYTEKALEDYLLCEDTYNEWNFGVDVINEAIRYGLSHFKKEYHVHAINYIFKDIGTMEEIAKAISEETGVPRTHQAVSITFRRIRSHIKDYLIYEENKRIIETNKKLNLLKEENRYVGNLGVNKRRINHTLQEQ